MATISKCSRCEQRRFLNYTGMCKRCNKAEGLHIWAKNRLKNE